MTASPSSGSKAGGGIFAVSGAYGLEITNNNITNNQGNFAGGIAIGTPDSGFPADSTGRSLNQGIVIRHNKIHRNGGIQGGGGIALNEGSEGYLVEENLITGNFGRYNGGGIQHRGLSIGDNVIRGNRILFNEIFFGALLALAGDGAGIYIGGDTVGGTGSGSVTIDSNLIQGNMTGSGNGGGIRAFAMNAQDVLDSPANDTTWYRLNIFNNMIVNNVAGNSGAGISLQDVARANIVNNTVARNDSTATSALSFQAGQANSTPQPAGIASALHSTILQGLLGVAEPTYSNPLLENNIIWQNRSFFNDASLNAGAGGLAVNPAGEYWDIHVVGSVADTDPHLDPDYCILTSLTNPATGFDYTRGYKQLSPIQDLLAPTSMFFNRPPWWTKAAMPSTSASPRLPSREAIITSARPRPDRAYLWRTFPELAFDFDGEARPFGTNTDIGADEIQGGAGALAPLSRDGKKGNPSLVAADMGPLSSIPRTNSITENQAPFTGRVITGQFVSRIDAVKEKMAGMWERIVPGRSHPDGFGGDETGSGAVSPLTVNVPGIATEKDVPAGTVQPSSKGTIQGDDVLNPVNGASLPRPEGEGVGPVFSSPVQGEASLPGNGAERGLLAAKADQSGTALAVARQQGESNSTVFRYVLVGLTLCGLGLIYFIVIMPKTIKRREQEKRGEI